MAERGWQPHGAEREGGGLEMQPPRRGTNRPRKGEKERVNARILIMATRPGCGLADVLFLATCFVRFREALRLRMDGTLQLPALFHPRISLYSGGRVKACYIFRLLFDDAEIQMMTKEGRRFVVQRDFFKSLFPPVFLYKSLVACKYNG